MGKINKKYTKEVEENEGSGDDHKSESEHEQEETRSEKKRKANDSEDEPLSPSKKSKKAAKKSPAKSNGKKAKSKKEVANNDDEFDADDADVNGEEEYEVKEIIDHKVEGGKSFYLVRWKGYTKDDDTWEPKDSLSCKDLIQKYEKKNAEAAASNGKSKKKNEKKSPKAAKGRKAGLPADPSKEWEVDKIIDYAEEKGVTLYRIRWKGFSAKNDTWEPRDNLFCDDLIEKFEKRMKQLDNVTFKELREEPKKTKRLVNETAPRTNITNKIGRSSKRSGTKKRVYYGDSDE